ncbi:hypothetical protein ACFL2V_06560 [Pseudomonadota bacterium]
MALIHSRNGTELLNTSSALIIIGVNKPVGHTFKLDKETGFTYRCPIREENVPVYFLREGLKSDGNTFDAHFCPYGADEVHGIRVDKSYNYFFTATLTGCNLGFGPLNKTDGSRWVGHSNAMTVGDLVHQGIEGDPSSVAKARMVQQTVQTKMLQSKEPLSESVTPSGYGRPLTTEDDIKTTVIGLRDTKTNAWTYIRQNYQSTDFQ